MLVSSYFGEGYRPIEKHATVFFCVLTIQVSRLSVAITRIIIMMISLAPMNGWFKLLLIICVNIIYAGKKRQWGKKVPVIRGDLMFATIGNF